MEWNRTQWNRTEQREEKRIQQNGIEQNRMEQNKIKRIRNKENSYTLTMENSLSLCYIVYTDVINKLYRFNTS
jgi:hypothetical protein